MIDNVTFIVSPYRLRFGPAAEADLAVLQLHVPDIDRAFRKTRMEGESDRSGCTGGCLICGEWLSSRARISL